MSDKNELHATNTEAPMKAFELGKRNEKTNTGCAQSAIAAVLDALGIESEDAFKAASGLADGIGLTGDGSCGALTGGVMAIGLVFGRERKDFNDPFKPMTSYRLSKELHDYFIEKYASCRCHDIQKKLTGRSYDLWKPEELSCALNNDLAEHCSTVVGDAARKTVEIILTNKES